MDRVIIEQIITDVLSNSRQGIQIKCSKPKYISKPTEKDKEFLSKFFNEDKLPESNLDEDYIENYNVSKSMDDAEKEYEDTYERIGQQRIFDEVLTEEERVSVGYWSGQSYMDINYYSFNVRGDKLKEEKYAQFHDLDSIEKLTSNLESAIHKSERIDENRHAFRYDGEGLGFTVKEGEVITTNGFTATSYNEDIATVSRDYDDEMMEEIGEEHHAYVKDIYIPKGTEGMFIGGGEEEVLLPPATRMYCFNIDKENRRAKFVVLPPN